MNIEPFAGYLKWPNSKKITNQKKYYCHYRSIVHCSVPRETTSNKRVYNAEI